MTPPSIPPVRRTVTVWWDPDAAFHRFTAEFAEWWPRATHSIGGKLVKEIVFECRAGGSIIEELADGRRYQWGRINAFEPPHRVAFTWHPSDPETSAQDVEVLFHPQGSDGGSGTRVELVATGWERLGAKARRARRGYDIGWGSVLEVYAGRRNAAFVIFGVISTAMTAVLRLTGRLDRMIEKARGRLPDRSDS
jgi:uncharacterized protein YndB with AHSA1/START domain